MLYRVWLRPNRRPAVLLVAAAAAAAIAAMGMMAAAAPWKTTGQQLVLALAASILITAVIAAARAGYRAACPRIYCRGREVFFRLGGKPVGVPLVVVEAFFLGQGPAHLPGRTGGQLETVNLVVRLSQRAAEWQRRDVDPRVAAWCEGYITIRGTHCEPLGTDTIVRLNRWLVESQQESAP